VTTLADTGALSDVAPTKAGESRTRRAAHRMFVAERPAWPLAIARIVIGIATLGWALSMWFDATTFLGGDALVGTEFDSSLWRWLPIDSDLDARLALVALVVAAIAIIVGWKPTVWFLVAFVLLTALQRRAPSIINSGDLILRNLTLLLAFTPTGAALSVDRVRRFGRDALFTSGRVAPWGLRLVQLQMMIVYLFAFWSKSGESWRDGSAVSTVFRIDDLQRFGPVGLLVDSVAIVAILTWSTLALELALGGLLWAKRLRPWLIAGGIALHLSIDTFVLVGFFGITMIGGLMTFLDAERIDAWVTRARPQPAERSESDTDHPDTDHPDPGRPD